MRKFFFGLGIVTACLVVAAGIGVFFLARDGAALDAQSKAFVKNAVVAIADDWDSEALWQRSSARFRAVTKEQDLRNFFAAARQALGHMTAHDGPRGQATIMVTNQGRRVAANYSVRATFERGDADIQIGIVKDGAQWRIEGFHINSSTLMRSLVGFSS